MTPDAPTSTTLGPSALRYSFRPRSNVASAVGHERTGRYFKIGVALALIKAGRQKANAARNTTKQAAIMVMLFIKIFYHIPKDL